MDTSKLVHLPSAFKTRMQEVDASNAFQNNKNNRYLGRDLTDVFNTKSPNQIMKNLIRRRNNNLFDDIGVGDHFSLKPGIDYQEQTSPETKISISKFSSSELSDADRLPKYSYSFNAFALSQVFPIKITTANTTLEEYIIGVSESAVGNKYFISRGGEAPALIEFRSSSSTDLNSKTLKEILRSHDPYWCYFKFDDGFLKFNVLSFEGIWVDLPSTEAISQCNGTTYLVQTGFRSWSSLSGSTTYHNETSITIIDLDTGEEVYSGAYDSSHPSNATYYTEYKKPTPHGIVLMSNNVFGVVGYYETMGRTNSTGGTTNFVNKQIGVYKCDPSVTLSYPTTIYTIQSSSNQSSSNQSIYSNYKTICRENFYWLFYQTCSTQNTGVMVAYYLNDTWQKRYLADEKTQSISNFHSLNESGTKVCAQAGNFSFTYAFEVSGSITLEQWRTGVLDLCYSEYFSMYLFPTSDGNLCKSPTKDSEATIVYSLPQAPNSFIKFSPGYSLATDYSLFASADFTFSFYKGEVYDIASSSFIPLVAVGNSILYGSTVLDFTPSHTLRAVSGEESFIAVGDQGEGVLILPESTQEFTIDSQLNFKAIAYSNSNKWIAAGLNESTKYYDVETGQAGYPLTLYECTDESSMAWTKITSEFPFVQSVSLFPYQDTVVMFMKSTKDFKAYIQESDEWNLINLPQGCSQLISSSNYSSLIALTDSGLILISKDAGEHWSKLIQSPLSNPQLSWTPDATYVWTPVGRTIIAYKITADKVIAPSISLFVETGIKISPDSSFPETIILALLDKLGMYSYDISPNSARSLSIDDLTYAIKLPPLFKLNPDLYENIQHNWFLGGGNVLAPGVEILTEQTTGEAEIVLTFNL